MMSLTIHSHSAVGGIKSNSHWIESLVSVRMVGKAMKAMGPNGNSALQISGGGGGGEEGGGRGGAAI